MWRITLIALFLNSLAFGQTDSNNRQIEFAVSVYPYKNALGIHGAMGVNFPARKTGWHNNIMFASTTQDFTVKGSGSFVHFHTFSIGKNYQFIKKRFYFSAGLNGGLFYTGWQNNNLSTRNYGVCVVPRLEIGWNMKKVILAVGEYAAIGWGVYQKYIDGEIYYNNPDKFEILDRTHGGSIGIPYLRLILK